MAMFVLLCLDKPNALDLRMATREAHLAYVGTFGEAVKMGGPVLNEAGDMAGSLLILDMADMAAAKAFNAEDPYTKAGLFEKVELHPFRAAVGVR